LIRSGGQWLVVTRIFQYARNILLISLNCMNEAEQPMLVPVM